MVALVLVGLLHLLLGYVFVTGMATSAVQSILQEFEVVDVQDLPDVEDEPPPPPPEMEEIPPYVPPPDLPIELPPPPRATPQITTQTERRIDTPAPVAPKPEPKPVAKITPPKPNLRRSQGISDADYPAASLRAEEEGTTTVAITIGTDGRISDCQIARSSGHSRLDERTCELMPRRYRYEPATQDGTPIPFKIQQNVKWEISGRR